jgi:hypothetical protein
VGEAATSVGAFELLDRTLLDAATAGGRNPSPRPPPLAQEEFCSFLGAEGARVCPMRGHQHGRGNEHAAQCTTRAAARACLLSPLR